jgi:catecholate siderophore receptor
MLKKKLSSHATLQANVNNILNRYYIDEPHPSHLIPGPAANALVGLNYSF